MVMLMKKIPAILFIISVFSLLAGCAQIESMYQPAEAPAKETTQSAVDEVEQSISEIDDLEKELDISEFDELEQELDAIDW
jgi:exopolyphosphatase/pppGpp-phosphohydrolase